MIYLLDILVCIIVFSTLFVVVKKGFVRTVLDLTSVVAAIILANVFSSRLSEFLYDGIFKSLSNVFNKAVSALLDNNNLPDLLESDKISSFLQKYNSGLSNKINGGFAQETADYIAGQLVGLLAYVAAFLLIFAATVIVFKLASVVFGGIFELPVLKTVNKTLAFCLGVIISAFYVLVFVAVMQIAMPVLNSVYPDIFNAAEIDKTYIFRFLYNFEWIDFLV